MAINVDTVYRTVLLILNKEQRGYLTPDEFNRTAAQVQLEIFNDYFESLNQQHRLPGNDSEYSDRVKNLEEKISFFQREASCTYSAGEFTIVMPVTAPVTELYKLGTVIYKDEKEVQYVQPNELLELNLSPLTKPSVCWPVYRYKDSKIIVYPKTITSDITCTVLAKPRNPQWSFTATAPSFQYVYDPGTSVNFDLHPSEQTNVILNILLYSGVIIKDPGIVQAAAQQIQSDTINSKS
jgi:hypothetical protein